MEGPTIREYLSDVWSDFTGRQKMTVLAIVAFVLVLMFSGWFDSIWSRAKVYQAEREATKAKQDADAALRKAAEISAEIKRREDALEKVEEKRDAKNLEVDASGKTVADDRAAYDRAVRESRPDAPSTDQLCAELAELGYPCQ